MSKYIVTEQPSKLKLEMDDVQIITPLEYIRLTDSEEKAKNSVINLCNDYQYLSMGYYVSLLAQARKNKVIPDISLIQDFRLPSLIREEMLNFEDSINQVLKNEAEKVEFNIYLGLTGEEKFQKLASQIFNWIPVPFLKVKFEKKDNKWSVKSLLMLHFNEIDPTDHKLIDEAIKRYFKRHPRKSSKKFKYDLAILVNPDEPSPPSNSKALQAFAKAAANVGFSTELITKNDFGKLIQYDALLIRETTQVNHHTYRFAKKAAALGLAVMDDPDSILRCTNKVYLFELLKKHRIPTPESFIIDRSNYKKLPEDTNFPFVLKQPDGAFSVGVKKVENKSEYLATAKAMLQDSDLLIAQEFLPTPFDWRIGIVNNEVIFVCKYFMARNHWQIYNYKVKGKQSYGHAETLSPDQAPAGLIKNALKATSLIGDGLYGVDMKEINGKFLVIEINDNPNIDVGVEDRVGGATVYQKIMDAFLERIKNY